jgi:hypothetical protein
MHCLEDVDSSESPGCFILQQVLIGTTRLNPSILAF